MIGNGREGILVSGGSENHIARPIGNESDVPNVIGGNGLHGISLSLGEDTGHIVAGNFVGTNPAGDALGNAGAGIYVVAHSVIYGSWTAYATGDYFASCTNGALTRTHVLTTWLKKDSLTGTTDDRPTCNQCWGDNLKPNGTKLANQIVYRLFRCNDCGANVQGTRHSRAAITRGAS